jgi:hypothetical protein
MPDDKSKKGARDRDRINVHEKYEVQYSTKKFGVSEEELRAAVDRAGTSAAAVERDLKKKAA